MQSSTASTRELLRDKHQNQKLGLLADVFSEIRMNLNVNSEDEKEQEHVKDLISIFIDWVTEISDCLNSDAWRGEDVMGIFFNEFNRYKKKSESGQVFTPEHITDFMYKILEVNQNDRVLDATCGSGGFLVKAMANMIDEAGGVNTEKPRKSNRTNYSVLNSIERFTPRMREHAHPQGRQDQPGTAGRQI